MNADDDVESQNLDETIKENQQADELRIELLSPSGFIPEQRFIASGKARPGGDPIYLRKFDQDITLEGQGNVEADGSWSGEFLMPSGMDELKFYASQLMTGISRPKAINRYPTTLTSPRLDVLLDPDQVVFGGECYPGDRLDEIGMRIRVLEGTTELASVTVKGLATNPGETKKVVWEARPTSALSGKTYTVRAEYKVPSSEVLSYTDDLTFSVIDPRK